MASLSSTVGSTLLLVAKARHKSAWVSEKRQGGAKNFKEKKNMFGEFFSISLQALLRNIKTYR